MTPKTMAILITENTYPIAVACLSLSFLRKPPATVFGRYLVINIPNYFSPGSVFGGSKGISLGNHDYTAKDFAELFETVEPDALWREWEFYEVRRLK